MEHGKIYIISPIDTGKVIPNDNMRDVLGFKQNIINGRSFESTSGLNRVLFDDYLPSFSLVSCIFLCTSFIEISRIILTCTCTCGVNQAFPLRSASMILETFLDRVVRSSASCSAKASY